MIALLAAACAALPQGTPELVGNSSDWINSKPITLKSLRGKIVLVDFWEYTCVNCVRTFPYILEWQRRYEPLGLRIIGVHSPEFEFGKKSANVVAAAKRFGLRFPILLDNEHRNWRLYGVEGWPTKVLIDANGRQIHRTFGEEGYVAIESLIQREIRKSKPGVQLPSIMSPVHSADQSGAICYGKTPELFAGKRGVRDGQFGNPAVKVGRDSVFKYPSVRGRSQIFLDGWWSIKEEFAEGRNGSSIYVHYAAVDVNTVLHPIEPLTAEVLQDGKPVDKAALGRDVKLVSGRSILIAREPRMYSLVQNPKWGRHTLEIRMRSAGARLHSFSFTTECAELNGP